MLLSDFDYDLPLELIAQTPALERTASRLLVVDRSTSQRAHYRFLDIVSLLPPDCLLVVNDTRVFPARLRGRKQSGGAVEVLLLRRVAGEGESWDVLCKGAQGMGAGSRLWFAAELSAEWRSAPRAGRGVLRLFPQGDLSVLLDHLGEIPLPPYIKRPAGGHAQDRDRYQTVYARHPGAVAAPTAGLHFTDELLTALRQRGIETVFVTL